MIRIALLDGPIHQDFNVNDPGANPAQRHAEAVKAAVLSTNSDADVVSFPIFEESLRTRRDIVIKALYAAMESDAKVLHCSFGFAQPDRATQKAFFSAVSRFDCVVASSPARGLPVFPASYNGVVKASGDARLTGLMYSWLNTAQVDFAANPRPPIGFSEGGSSIGAARFSGILSAKLAEEDCLHDVLLGLRSGASYHGNERK